MSKANLKPKVCVQCGASYEPFQRFQKVCSQRCAILKIREERKHNEAAAFKRETKRLREAIKTPSDWAKDAEKAFNRYIRVRDNHLPCISCGNPSPGWDKCWNAGHYRPVSTAKQLRFNTFNVHKQCSQCNDHKSGNMIEYRANLIEKIGAERVVRLECDNSLAHHDIEYYKRITTIFTRRAKMLVKRRERAHV